MGGPTAAFESFWGGIQSLAAASAAASGGPAAAAAAQVAVAPAPGAAPPPRLLLPTVPRDDSHSLRTLRLDLGGGGTGSGGGGAEWLLLHHGAVYSPGRAFPLSVAWLVASAAAVEELVGSLHRRARNSGFALVAVPAATRCPSMMGGKGQGLGSTMRGQHPRSPAAGQAAAAGAAAEEGFASAGAPLPSFSLPVPLPGGVSGALASALAGLAAASAAAAVTYASPAPPPPPSALPPPLLLGLPPGAATPALLHALEGGLVARFGFVPDTAWRGGGGSVSSRGAPPLSPSGSPLPQPQLLHATPLCPGGWFRQYVHCSGAAFVRLHAGGAHWLANRIPLGRQQGGGVAAALAAWRGWGGGGSSGEDDDEEEGSGGGGDEAALLGLYRALAAWCATLVDAAAASEQEPRADGCY